MEDLKKIITKESLDECSIEVKEKLISIFFDEIPVFDNKLIADAEPNNTELGKGIHERSYSSLHPEIDESKLEELEEVISTIFI